MEANLETYSSLTANRSDNWQQETLSTSSIINQTSGLSETKAAEAGLTKGNVFSDLRNVDFNSVRKMIAQNMVELLIICVILTYLIYYFSQISRKPKLIGSNRSKFVDFIRTNFNETLAQRFNPLIYFWGTNPQTALFGYLQGQLSVHEMPRNHFRRQYLYVSDAQYLTSNVDLSLHYTRKLVNKKKFVPLEVCRLESEAAELNGSQLNKNIRLALSDMLLLEKTKANGRRPAALAESGEKSELGSSSGSSSDSGVFAGNHSTSSSACSLTDVVISSANSSLLDDTSDDEAAGGSGSCSCKSRYHLIGKSAAAHNNFNQQGEPCDTFGQCALDWHKASHKQYHENKLVALISAGMTTGSDKKYVTDTVNTLERLGYEVCVFIRRGVGGLKLSSRKFFSPAKWRDFEAAVESVRQQRPDARLVAVGFSFGSIELCRYLSMSGKQSKVDAALLVSCPFDPEAGGRNMQKRALNRKIDTYLARNLGKQLHEALSSAASAPSGGSQERQASLEISNLNGSLVDLAKLPKIKSLVDFEDNYNRVLQNYPNSEAYAADSRLTTRLGFIETPTLCLSSEDDFMAPLKLLPLEEIRANPNLCMLLTKRGGHMAFIDGLFWPRKPYFAQRIISKYMEAVRVSLQSAIRDSGSGQCERAGGARIAAQVRLEMGSNS